MQISLKNQKEYRALNSILQNISVYLLENGITHLNVDEAKSFYHDFLHNRGFEIDAEDFFERTTSRCPIICLLQNNSIFAFKHKSFVEFYYAKSLLNNPLSSPLNELALSEYWSHTFYFYVGLVEEPDQILTEFINIKPESDIDLFNKYTNLSDLLLAGYAAKTEVLINGLAEAAITAARFYCNAVKNPKTSSLRNFSQLHLLWLTQYTFKSSFHYDFFKSRFPEVSLRILEKTSDEQEQAIAIFLIDVTLLIDSKAADFKYLEKSFKKFPLSLKLGICHESEGKKKGKFVKKLDKNMKDRIRSDKSLQTEIEKLYKTSIESFSKL